MVVEFKENNIIMISIILRNELKTYYKKLPIKYDHYINWLDDKEVKLLYYIISTTTADIRKREKWNKKGREIYDIDKLDIHVQYISEIINYLNLKKFIVQHEYLPSIWFPKHLIVNKSINNKISFIKLVAPNIEIHKFNGGFKVENQASDFIQVFIDYPFLLKYKNIDMLSMELDLIIKVTHHLSIDFVTLNKNLIIEIMDLCDKKNLKFFKGENI